MKPFIPSRVAEIIFALVLLVFGFNHIRAGEMMAGGVPIPGGVLWIYITGAGFMLAAIAIIINRFKTLACYLLTLMLLIFVALVHVPSFVGAKDQMGKMMPMVSILKDIAMAMGAILIGNNVSTQPDAGVHKKGNVLKNGW